MNRANHDTAVQALRWFLGLFLIWKSFLLFREIVSNLRIAGHIGPHTAILLALSGLEIVAAAMFLAPMVKTAGGYLLLGVFALAAIFHILHGELNNLPSLAIYALAVLVCLTNRPSTNTAQP
jgi:hypothetical protein